MGHGLTISVQSCVSILRNKTLQNNWMLLGLISNLKHQRIFQQQYHLAIQLQVADLSIFLSSVKASMYGIATILGLDFDKLYLTEGS